MAPVEGFEICPVFFGGCHVRRAHGIGVAGKYEPRFGGLYAAEVMSLDVATQRDPDVRGHTSMHVSRRIHPSQLSLYEFIPEPVVGHV